MSAALDQAARALAKAQAGLATLDALDAARASGDTALEARILEVMQAQLDAKKWRIVCCQDGPVGQRCYYCRNPIAVRGRS